MNLDRVMNKLLTPADLNLENLQSSLNDLCRSHIDYGDLYFKNSISESWYIEDGIVKNGQYAIQQGVGVRAISGEKTGFAYSDEISPIALRQSVRAARSIVRVGQNQKAKIITESKCNQLYLPLNPVKTLERDQKIKLLQDLDAYARGKCTYIKQFTASISCSYDNVLIAATDGTLAADIRPLVRLSCSVVVEKNGRTESGYCGGGGRTGYDHFFETVGNTTRAYSYVDEAIRSAMVNLEAVDTPAGVFPVVLGAGWAGVLIHEAVGHGLEGDSCRRGESMFSKLMGQKVSSELCTIVDDGTIAKSRGSLSVDDEGVPTKYNVLIEDGKLAAFMYDKHNARLVGKESTGNGRRMSYACEPITRMTNTYMLPGHSSPEEIISTVKKGIYAVNFGGGQVDPASGQFVFSVQEAYLLENGKVTTPIRGATLIGNAIEVMNQISMVGNDLKFDQGIGTCGKGGQMVPVGIGIPTLKLDAITVGGTR